MLKPIQISPSAPIIPSMRVSTSVALSSLRIPDSVGAALVALGAAEVMLPPDLIALRPRRQGATLQTESRAAPGDGEASFVSLGGGRVNSAAELHRAGLHAGADFRLGDPALVDDYVEVLPGDRKRRQQNAIDLHALGAAGEGMHVGNVGQLLAGAKHDSRLASGLAEIPRVLQIETVWVPSAMRLIAA